MKSGSINQFWNTVDGVSGYGWGKSGSAFNVKGNIGLQLYLKNGKKVLFGTQRPDALKRAMDKMMKEE